jgi:hypothetical protein
MYDFSPGKSIEIIFIRLLKEFCSMHGSGERLSQLTGIAAILRFPMPDLDLAEDHHANEPNNEDEEGEFEHNEATTNHIDNPDANRVVASAW